MCINCKSVLKDINITETLNLLQGSTVSFDNVDFHDAKISIYNSEPEDPEKPLLSFDKQINEQPSKISIFKSEEGKILEDDNIVLINQQDSIFIEEQCNQWANKIAGGDYNQKQCVPDEKEKNRKLVVQKESNSGGGKKNKLSGGAIAGIVIACVVVVAAIIALFVYFLVIKKKNASTTSTQGDSSIAIKI